MTAPSQSSFRHDVAAVRWYLEQPSSRARADVICRSAPSHDVHRLAVGVRLVHADAYRRVGRQAFPSAIEQRFTGILRARTRDMNVLLRAAISKAFAGTDIDERARRDSKSDDIQRLLQVVARIERVVARESPVDPAELYAVGEQLDMFTTRAVIKQLASVVGIDVTANEATSAELLDEWVATNVDLITSLDARYFDDIREAVADTVTSGKSTGSLMDTITERYGVSTSRAELIAVDQIGKLNGQITAARQQDLGIDEFVWSSSRDERVRPLHQEIDGKTYTWAKGHPTEHYPGEPIRCRCSAIPVV